MEIYFCHVNLTFCNVHNTNCNPNPGIEVAHGEMMAFRRLALHLIHLILTNIVYICQFQFVITQKQKIVRVSSFDIMQVTNRATISNRHQHFII